MELLKKRPALSREDMIVWGAEALVLLLLLILALDAALFYRALRPPESKAGQSFNAPVLTEEELKEVVRLLDDREQKFEEILGKE